MLMLELRFPYGQRIIVRKKRESGSTVGSGGEGAMGGLQPEAAFTLQPIT